MKVSVIVPVYNVEKYLPCCLDSLVNQTLQDMEIICINDGSTDNSLRILQEYASKYNNIKIINQSNRGLGGARNVGVENAQGEYIGYLDSDDFADKFAFEKLYTAAKQNDADVVLSNFYLYMNDTGYIFPYRDMKLIHRLNSYGAFSAKDHPEVLLNVGCWDKLFRRSFLSKNDIKFPEKRIYEDFKYSYKTLICANKIVALYDRLFYYRKNTGISITDQEKKNDNFKFDFIKNYEEIIDEWNTHPKWKNAFEKPISLMLIRDGAFHISNITNKSIFKKFFFDISNLINADTLSYIKTLKNEKLTSFVNFLLKKEWQKCYKSFNIEK